MAIRVVYDVKTGKATEEQFEFKENLDEIKKLMIEHVRAEAKRIILERYPTYKQRNAALGLLDTKTVEEMKAFIQSIRDECNRIESEILAAQDLATLQAIKPNWPQI